MDDKGEKAKLLAEVPERAWDEGPMGSSEAGKEPMGIEIKQQQHVKDERLVYLDNHALPHVAEN